MSFLNYCVHKVWCPTNQPTNQHTYILESLTLEVLVSLCVNKLPVYSAVFTHLAYGAYMYRLSSLQVGQSAETMYKHHHTYNDYSHLFSSVLLKRFIKNPISFDFPVY